jgi:hypothetical protein
MHLNCDNNEDRQYSQIAFSKANTIKEFLTDK